MAKGNLVKIGEFKKTRRADMLNGFIEIPEMGLKIRVLAFLKTNEQKRNKSEPDLVLLMPTGDKPTTEVPDNLFD